MRHLREFRGPSIVIAGISVLVLSAAGPPEADSTATPATNASRGAGDSEDSADENGDENSVETAPLLAVPERLKTPPLGSVKPLPAEYDLIRAAKREGAHLVVRRGDSQDVMTIDLLLQQKLDGIMHDYRPPYAAVVAIEPSTGRVLAMVEHSSADPAMRGLVTKAVFPAASIFKIVTAAALMESGMDPDQSVCSYGGKRKISINNLVDSSRDGACYTLSRAFAKSANAIFAKMTVKFLSAATLRKRAESLFFNRPIPFAVPTDVSLAAIPDEPLGLANTGAGFGDVYLSPLHGALLAASIANDGVWRKPKLFEGEEEPESGATRILTSDLAHKLAEMMGQTVFGGTARKVFRERGHQVRLAAGKTGSLADKRPYRDYSWFVGFAPMGTPKIAVAAVIVNNMVWRIRAPWLAREAMRLYLH